MLAYVCVSMYPAPQKVDDAFRFYIHMEKESPYIKNLQRAGFKGTRPSTSLGKIPRSIEIMLNIFIPEQREASSDEAAQTSGRCGFSYHHLCFVARFLYRFYVDSMPRKLYIYRPSAAQQKTLNR